MGRPHRVIGTTEEALRRAESQLGRPLPSSFRAWLLVHNGKEVEGVHVFPVHDDRDPRKTWDSIVRQYDQWRSYCTDVFDEVAMFEYLVPIASFGTGNYYCFDFSRSGEVGEHPVVLWSHETGATSPRAESFAALLEKVQAGEFEFD